MRRFCIFILLYLLFIIQTGILPHSPDFVLIALIVIALHEDKITSTLFGFLIGLCFDLTTPTTLGINMLTLSIIAYSVNILRNLFYRSNWQPLFFTFLGLIFKNILFMLNGLTQYSLTWLLTTPLTLILSLFTEPVLVKIFYRQNKS